MSFSQLFPLKDATIYSDTPTQNTGMDEIIEFTKSNQYNSARVLIQFDQTEINNIISQTTPGWKSYLRLYASQTEGLPTELPIICDPISQEWDMGTGRRGNNPITVNGVSWLGPKTGSFWVTSSGTTSSYTSGSTGGGSWYTGYTVSQSITQYTNQDVYLDVTNQITDWNNNTIDNNGFILRVSESKELNPNYIYHLSYFSRDTNTIYPPSLIFYWDDQVVNPDTSSVLTTDVFDVGLQNNKGIFQSEENVLFRVYGRETYPTRTFVTQSLYTYNKLLPSSSWFQIVDVDTNDTIIPFNDLGTKISSDTISSYFTVDMSTLEPERYYTIQVKTQINGRTYIKNNDRMTFKVQQKV